MNSATECLTDEAALILKILINVSCVGYGIIYFKYNPPTLRRYNDFLTALVEGQKE